MTEYRRLRAEAGWSPKTYLAEVWGYDSIADVDSDTWHHIEQCAANRYYLDVVLSRARRRYCNAEEANGQEQHDQ